MRPISRNDHLHEPSLLDDEDLKLVHALQLAPRAGWTSLAGILGVHSTTLAARWKRLTEAGIAWVAAHPVETKLCPVTAFVEVQCAMTQRDAVIHELTSLADVVSLDISARHRDLLLTVVATSIAQFTEATLPMITGVPGVEHIETSFTTQMHVIADAWTLRALTPDQRRRVANLHPRTTGAQAVPKVHLGVLRALSVDGRASAADIARQLEMSEVTVRRQIRAAMVTGLINIRCELAQDVSGLPITAQWFASAPASQHGALAACMTGIPGVRMCASTTGRTNILIAVWLRSVTEVPLVERRLAEAVPGIILRESAIALRIVKRIGWMLGPGGRANGQVVPPSWGAAVADPGLDTHVDYSRQTVQR